jgi:hypothetical protein
MRDAGIACPAAHKTRKFSARFEKCWSYDIQDENSLAKIKCHYYIAKREASASITGKRVRLNIVKFCGEFFFSLHFFFSSFLLLLLFFSSSSFFFFLFTFSFWYCDEARCWRGWGPFRGAGAVVRGERRRYRVPKIRASSCRCSA